MERTALGEKILKHWRENRPQMVSDLEKSNRLEQAVLEAQELTGDLLYELVSVKKMDYQPAWEMATREWAFLSGEDRQPKAPSPSGKSSRSGRSAAAPVARLPDKRCARHRRRRAEGKGARQHRRHPRSQADRIRKPRSHRRRESSARAVRRMGRLAERFSPLPAARVGRNRALRSASS